VPDSTRIDDLRRRVHKDPASIAFAQLAEELRRVGAIDESIATCRAGLAIHPGYLSARVTLGRALLESNALDEARGELQTVLKSAPENLAAIRGLAEIFHRQGQLPDALAQYRAALALAKNDPDLQQTVAELAKIVEPQRPAHVSEGLSFEQVSSELFGALPPSPLATAPSTLESAAGTFERAVVQSIPSSPDSRLRTPESDLLDRQVAALQQWLDAIHVARTQPRA
jgi:tetratricopeptide (TPR) repeat protein